MTPKEYLHLQDKTYAVTIGSRTEVRKGNLILPNKLIVGGYVITIENGGRSKYLLLDGDRIKRIRFYKE